MYRKFEIQRIITSFLFYISKNFVRFIFGIPLILKSFSKNFAINSKAFILWFRVTDIIVLFLSNQKIIQTFISVKTPKTFMSLFVRVSGYYHLEDSLPVISIF